MKTCYLCKSNKNDVYLYGDIVTYRNISVHTYCLYLSSNLAQRSENDLVFYGFLPKDIRKEERRAAAVKCYYCHKSYASIGCCHTRCRKSFHLICGIKNGAENQFTKNFKSFCHIHAKNSRKRKPGKNETCFVCYDGFYEDTYKIPPNTVLEAPCCQNGWFHKICLQRFAKSAGYFFKCPLCNNEQNFRKKLSLQGIFLHDRDAIWELEPNAYHELYERPNTCCSKNCRCPNDKQNFIFCNVCGGIAIHQKCIEGNNCNSFRCDDCKLIDGGNNSGGGDSGHSSLEQHNEVSIYYADSNDNSIISVTDSGQDHNQCSNVQTDSSDDDVIIRKSLNNNKLRRIYDSSSETETTYTNNNTRLNRCASQRILYKLESNDLDIAEIVENKKHQQHAFKRNLNDETSSESSQNNECNNNRQLVKRNNKNRCKIRRITTEKEKIPNDKCSDSDSEVIKVWNYNKNIRKIWNKIEDEDDNEEDKCDKVGFLNKKQSYSNTDSEDDKDPLDNIALYKKRRDEIANQSKMDNTEASTSRKNASAVGQHSTIGNDKALYHLKNAL